MLVLDCLGKHVNKGGVLLFLRLDHIWGSAGDGGKGLHMCDYLYI